MSNLPQSKQLRAFSLLLVLFLVMSLFSCMFRHPLSPNPIQEKQLYATDEQNDEHTEMVYVVFLSSVYLLVMSRCLLFLSSLNVSVPL